MTLLYILTATVTVGLISLIGILFFVAKMDIRKSAFYFVSLASGTMLGTAIIHLLPEALELSPHTTPTMVALGVFLFFILEKLLIWRHCHLHNQWEHHHRPVTAHMVIVGDAVHNFIDGIIIASSFMISTPLGISVTTAIVLHEIPQELGDFGILVHGGYTMKRAVMMNCLAALSAIAGAVITYFFLEAAPMMQASLVPITAGGFLYIALADLIPQLHEQAELKHTALQIVLLAAGFGMVMLLRH